MDRGATMPLFGRTQYFFGLVVLTYGRNVARFQSQRYHFRVTTGVEIAFAGISTRSIRFTLKATCLSVLFVSCSVHEICLFNSTAWFDREKETGRHQETKETVQDDRGFTSENQDQPAKKHPNEPTKERPRGRKESRTRETPHGKLRNGRCWPPRIKILPHTVEPHRNHRE